MSEQVPESVFTPRERTVMNARLFGGLAVEAACLIALKSEDVSVQHTDGKLLLIGLVANSMQLGSFMQKFWDMTPPNFKRNLG